jgi:hypothetical protein
MSNFEILLFWLGWWSISFGISFDLGSPNIEIHLPFFFIKAGFKSKRKYSGEWVKKDWLIFKFRYAKRK